MGSIDKRYITVILCAIGAFLAVVGGGQVVVDTIPYTADSSVLPNLFGGMELPLLSHSFSLLFFVAALLYGAWDRKVLQLPHFRLMAVFGFFLGLLILSLTVSLHKNLTVISILEWASYGAGMLAVVMTVGRGRGPEVVLSGIAGGGLVLALVGLREYATEKAIDPNWRIFATWNNPNALAGMLVVAFFVAVSLCASSPKPRNVIWGLAAGVMGLALFLTQSKGGLLALVAGTAVWVVVGTLKAGFKSTTRGMVPIALVFVLAALLIASQKAQSAGHPGSSAAGSRIANVGASAEQSAGFRKQLWKSTILLTQMEPIGVGLGTYRFHSSRPGLVTQTQFAHNSLLQLGAEATVLAPITLLVALFMWARGAWKSSKEHWESHRLMSAGVFSAIAASFLHNLVDCDWYFFGGGMIFFVLLGVGLQLAVDGTTPEFVPRNIRFPAVATASLLLLGGIGAFTYEQLVKSQTAGARVMKQEAAMTAGLESLKSIAWQDSEASYMQGLYPTNLSPEQRLPFLQQSMAEGPNQRSARLLARLNLQLNKPSEAISQLTAALRQDPNNLTTLRLLADAHEQNGDTENRTKTLDRLIAVESSDYFKIRSLPELIPLETYEARVLRSQTLSGQAQIDMLLPAVKGYSEFLTVTLPRQLNGSLGSIQSDDSGRFEEQMKYATHAISILRAAGCKDEAIASLEQDLADGRKKIADAQKATN